MKGLLVIENKEYSCDVSQEYAGQRVNLEAAGEGFKVCSCADGNVLSFANEEIETLILQGPKHHTGQLDFEDIEYACAHDKYIWLSIHYDTYRVKILQVDHHKVGEATIGGRTDDDIAFSRRFDNISFIAENYYEFWWERPNL